MINYDCGCVAEFEDGRWIITKMCSKHGEQFNERELDEQIESAVEDWLENK